MAFSLFSQSFSTKQNAVIGVQSVEGNAATATPRNESLFYESFEGETLEENGWLNVDADGDENSWFQYGLTAHEGTKSAASASWSGGVALTPENWLISPAIDLGDETGTVFLDWYAKGQDQTWPYEHYKVVVSTTGTEPADFTDIIFEETLEPNGPDGNDFWKRSVNISQYAGEFVYIAFVHYNVTDMFYFVIDDISVYSNNSVDCGIISVASPNNEDACALTDSEEVSVEVFNYGGTEMTGFDISYTVGDGATVTETFSDTIAPGASMVYTFAQHADLSELGYYSINFEITVADDENPADNTFTHHVSSTDAVINIAVVTDDQGSQAWSLVNSAGDTIATHGSYQWNITESTDVCVIEEDCYTFTWVNGTENTVTLSFNGEQMYEVATLEDFVFPALGSTCAQNSASLISVNTPEVSPLGSVDIAAVMFNGGGSAINSYSFHYGVAGSADSEIYTVSGVDFGSGTSNEITHNVPFNFTEEGEFEITVTLDSVNGVFNENINKTASTSIVVTDNAVQRQVYVMNFTTGKCVACPRMHSALAAYADANPGRMILIAHHAGFQTDIMTTVEDSELLALYNVPAAQTFAPAVAIDRVFLNLPGEPGTAAYIDSADVASYIDDRYEVPSLVNLSMEGTYDGDTKEVQLTINGSFVANTHIANPRLSLYVKEDGIIAEQAGTGGGDNYVHDNVMRKAISNNWGDAGIITSTDANATFSKTYTFTLESNWVPENLEFVAFVNNYDESDPNNREVYNAVEIALNNLVVGVNDTGTFSFGVYPNPTSGELFVTNVLGAKVEVMDVLGQVVTVVNEASETQTIDMSALQNGTYFVKVSKEEGAVTRKITLVK